MRSRNKPMSMPATNNTIMITPASGEMLTNAAPAVSAGVESTVKLHVDMVEVPSVLVTTYVRWYVPFVSLLRVYDDIPVTL